LLELHARISGTEVDAIDF